MGVKEQIALRFLRIELAFIEHETGLCLTDRIDT